MFGVLCGFILVAVLLAVGFLVMNRKPKFPPTGESMGATEEEAWRRLRARTPPGGVITLEDFTKEMIELQRQGWW